MNAEATRAGLVAGTGARRGRASYFLEGAFLVLALAILALWHRTPAVRTLSLLFSSIVLEGLPFMLLGAFAGGLVETFVSRERMASLLPRRRWLAVLGSAGLGVLLPVCECAVVPIARRLARKGVPVQVLIAYLLGAPIVNPIVAASTAVAYRFDWGIVGARVLVGYAIAVTVALVFGRILRGRAVFAGGIEEAATAEEAPPHAPGVRPSVWWRLGESLRHGADDFVSVGHYFVIGAFIAAAAQTFIDRNVLAQITGRPGVAIVLMMLLAVALNLCSEADAFVASSFRGLLPVSSQLAFLLLGPILDLKLLLMYQTLFRRRVIATLAAFMVAAVLLAALGLHASGRFP